MTDPSAENHGSPPAKEPGQDTDSPPNGDSEATPDPWPYLVSIPPTGAVYRLPDPDDPVEAHLAAANRADREFSLVQLRRLFPDLSVDDAEPAGLLEVDRARLARLFDMDLLDDLLDHGVDPSRLALSNWQFLGDIKNSALPEPDSLHAAIAGRAASDGGHVTLVGIERTTPGLRRLAEHVGRAWQARVSITAVVGTGAFAGQNSVQLPHDHIVIPVRGLRNAVATMPDGSPLHSGPVGPGQALYLPAGASFATNAVNELFAHLEVRVERPVPLSLLPLITALPVAQQSAWTDGDSSLRNSLLARWCVTLPTRPGTRFSSMYGPQTPGKYASGWVRPTLTGGWCRLVPDADAAGVVMVVAAGVCVRMPEALLPVLQHTLSGPPKNVSEATAESPTAQRLVDLLVISGLLEFSPTGPVDDGWDADYVESGGSGAV